LFLSIYPKLSKKTRFYDPTSVKQPNPPESGLKTLTILYPAHHLAVCVYIINSWSMVRPRLPKEVMVPYLLLVLQAHPYLQNEKLTTL